jgi:transcriptional regulator with XRE-family HTH domain/predicted negative regulator of RcsB-dependent stress response
MEMGKEIRRLRTDRGLTQEALASALHVTAQTVSKWECGTSFPDVQLLPEIAVFFGVTIDRLFAMTPEQELERLENHIAGSGLLSESETRRIEQQLRAIAETPAHAGRALTILTGLFNHQAERYRECAVTVGREAVERSEGSGDAISELANAWNSYIPDWCCRNHHALIEWFSDYCRRNPSNRPALMWLLDNLIDDRRLAEAREWLGRLEQIDDTFRTSMYRCLLAQAAGEREEAGRLLNELETMEGQDWSWALTVGDLFTQRQEYDKAVSWYRRAQEMQPAPKFVDSAESIAHICEIRGDRAGAADAYREQLRLLEEDWGIVSGEEHAKIERAIQKLQ